jgi:hypothetical protein
VQFSTSHGERRSLKDTILGEENMKLRSGALSINGFLSTLRSTARDVSVSATISEGTRPLQTGPEYLPI